MISSADYWNSRIPLQDPGYIYTNRRWNKDMFICFTVYAYCYLKYFRRVHLITWIYLIKSLDELRDAKTETNNGHLSFAVTSIYTSEK